MREPLPAVSPSSSAFRSPAGTLKKITLMRAFLEGGDSLFVGSAAGFVRLNLAMPRAIVEKACRMRDAVQRHQAAR